MLISIDQSYTGTGICYMSEDGRIENFLVKTTAKDPWETRIDSILSAIHNAWNLSSIKMKNPSKVEHIIMESYAYGGNMPFTLGELGGVIKYSCYKRGIKVVIIPIAHHKMFVARKGNAKKPEVMKMLGKRFNIHVTNDNIADAISMALLYKARLDSLEGIPPEEPYDRALIARLEANINGRKSGRKTKKNSSKKSGKAKRSTRGAASRSTKKSNGKPSSKLCKKSSRV